MTAGLPALHAGFLREASERLRDDARIVGLAIGGSLVAGAVDEWSDLDFVVAVEPDAEEAVLADRVRIAARLGRLVAAFTGEHVGEPRLLICLYGPPLLHVDLKFVRLPDVAARVADPTILWERGGRLTAALGATRPVAPVVDRQWIEDRFWVWVHYVAGKIGRGELYEAHDALAFLRARVFGPLAAAGRGVRPSGVRKIERVAPDVADAMRATLVGHDAVACVDALRAAVRLYRRLRDGAVVERRADAEALAVAYLDDVAARVGAGGG